MKRFLRLCLRLGHAFVFYGNIYVIGMTFFLGVDAAEEFLGIVQLLALAVTVKEHASNH